MKLIAMCLSLCFCGTVISVSSTTEKKNDYCHKDSLSEVDLSYLEMDDLRSDRENDFTEEYYDIIKFLKDPEDHSDDLFDAFMGPAVVLIIFMFILLVTFIILPSICI